MRKLIEMHQEHEVVCDNPQCDFKLSCETGEIIQFLNVSCPECGENLLTEKDYLDNLSVLKVINWLNRYFSWIMLFVPKKAKMINTTVHVHKGVKVSTEV